MAKIGGLNKKGKVNFFNYMLVSPFWLFCILLGDPLVTSSKLGLELIGNGLPGMSSPPYLTPT